MYTTPSSSNGSQDVDGNNTTLLSGLHKVRLQSLHHVSHLNLQHINNHLLSAQHAHIEARVKDKTAVDRGEEACERAS